MEHEGKLLVGRGLQSPRVAVDPYQVTWKGSTMECMRVTQKSSCHDVEHEGESIANRGPKVQLIEISRCMSNIFCLELMSCAFVSFGKISL